MMLAKKVNGEGSCQGYVHRTECILSAAVDISLRQWGHRAGD